MYRSFSRARLTFSGKKILEHRREAFERWDLRQNPLKGFWLEMVVCGLESDLLITGAWELNIQNGVSTNRHWHKSHPITGDEKKLVGFGWFTSILSTEKSYYRVTVYNPLHPTWDASILKLEIWFPVSQVQHRSFLSENGSSSEIVLFVLGDAKVVLWGTVVRFKFSVTLRIQKTTDSSSIDLLSQPLEAGWKHVLFKKGDLKLVYQAR